MRINYKLITALAFILVGIILIFYAEHSMHKYQAAAEMTKPFFERVQDFFVHLGNKISGAPELKMPDYTFRMKIFLGIGVALALTGVLIIAFFPRKRD